jgi:hypothetical protein
MYSIKSLLQLLKLSLHGQWASLFHTRVPTQSYLASYFLVPMAAANIGPLVQY